MALSCLSRSPTQQQWRWLDVPIALFDCLSRRRAPRFLKLPVDDLAPLSGESWARYALGVLWVLGVDTGVELLIDGRVPLGAGLSSSAALECSIATAVNHLFAKGLSLAELARATQKAENDYVGVPCGIMDQSVSLMAKSGSALLLRLSRSNI